MNKLTQQQSVAVAAEGNVAVIAGAGTGKTRTLVERCVSKLTDTTDPANLDEILVVTFTEAAAAEMKSRIRTELENIPREALTNTRRLEQLALLDSAQISTLHSFCLKLVQRHFFELGLDAELRVLDDLQSSILQSQTLDKTLGQYYTGTDKKSADVQNLILTQATGNPEIITGIILKLHERAQTLPNPRGWFNHWNNHFSANTPECWEKLVFHAFGQLKARWLPELLAQPAENENAASCAEVLERIPDNWASSEPFDKLDHSSFGLLAEITSDIIEIDSSWPKGKKTVFRKPIKKFFDELIFLDSIVNPVKQQDDLNESHNRHNAIADLEQDWEWTRHHMLALLELTCEFSENYAAAKRDQGFLDFHDLEQFTLDLLLGEDRSGPTAIARQWRDNFKHIFVDEYQDINAAQDLIIRALGKNDPIGNRFLVGDAKQSIYGFRSADPRIFTDYEEAWRNGHGACALHLNENFRSHESIIRFVNSFFESAARDGFDECGFDEASRLEFGDEPNRQYFTVEADKKIQRPGEHKNDGNELQTNLDNARGEFNLISIPSKKESSTAEQEQPDIAESSELEKMAALTARRLRRIKASGFNVWDKDLGAFRTVDWRDMAVLLRSTRTRSEVFAKEFARFQIPLETGQNGFFDAYEINDLLNLLRIFDNPLQDIPLLAVLRSPFARLTEPELAGIRSALPRVRFWHALHKFNDSPDPDAFSGTSPETKRKLQHFLDYYTIWRRATKQLSLSRCLETILDDSFYEDWVQAQNRGEQRRQNIAKLLDIARNFDQFSNQGLGRFLQLIDVQERENIEPETDVATPINAVRLISIHKSKGLEFPVVVVPDLNKKFNLEDTRSSIIFDESYGPCPKVFPPGSISGYESIPYWLSKHKQTEDTIAEELRLLYVAFTRACDKLILVGSIKEPVSETIEKLTPVSMPHVNNALNWLINRMPALTGLENWFDDAAGSTDIIAWSIHEDLETQSDEVIPGQAPERPATERTTDEVPNIEQRIYWEYPFAAATEQPSKTSASTMRRHILDSDEEPLGLFPDPSSAGATVWTPLKNTSTSAVSVGLATHKFLELAEPTTLLDKAGAYKEADRLIHNGRLPHSDKSSIDITSIVKFWSSEIGHSILEHKDSLYRELPFTARFSIEEINELVPAYTPLQTSLDDEFIVIQGFVDLAVIMKDNVWILDFKTDTHYSSSVDEKIRTYTPQILIYAEALKKVFNRPVTKGWLHFLSHNITVDIINGDN
ncbi:MAG: UvrD-helicase domain-containing protein [Verrucomicrobia bacterium]|nr:UvrD-helicase domain-containing protein [Verrucomicrobiota bacterium]